MPQFGNMYPEGATSIEKSIIDMQRVRPIFEGEDKNTFEKDGRYFFLGREVPKEEYEKGMNQYNAILEHSIEQKKEELADPLLN